MKLYMHVTTDEHASQHMLPGVYTLRTDEGWRAAMDAEAAWWRHLGAGGTLTVRAVYEDDLPEGIARPDCLDPDCLPAGLAEHVLVETYPEEVAP